MKNAIQKIHAGRYLTPQEIKQAFESLLAEETTDEEISEFLQLLVEVPLDADWLTEAARVLREHAVPLSLDGMQTLDTCGTGGDKSGSFNFSTAAALLAAACGAKVAKHGNRSITSKSGSADLLESLGIPINLSPEEAYESIKQNNFAFLMAPRYHPATQRVQKIRRQLKVVTVFNYLGPLSNPAKVPYQLLGVHDNALRPLMAEALRRLGVKKAWVVWGEGGLDEMSLVGKTHVTEVKPEGLYEFEIEPREAVLRTVDKEYLKGGDAKKNAKLLEGIFSKNFFGPIVNGILYNAGAALVVAGRAENIKEGVQMARLAIENGEALALLEELANKQ